MSLEKVLLTRRSVRNFLPRELTLEQISQLLWAAQGFSDPSGLRTAPSAGALYPLEIYLVTLQALYHYHPRNHQLKLHKRGDVRNGLYEAAWRQEAIIQAPVTLAIAAVYQRTAKKYGKERGERYVHLDCGHAAQNILLQAVNMGLGSVPIGAFTDARVKEVLSLPEDQEPIYLLPVGYPKREISHLTKD